MRRIRSYHPKKRGTRSEETKTNIFGRGLTANIALLWLLVVVFIVFAGSGAFAAGNLSPERKVEFEAFTMTAQYDPGLYEIGFTIAEQWRKLGFDVKITPIEFSRTVQLVIKQKDFDVNAVHTWGGHPARIDPDGFCYQIKIKTSRFNSVFV